MTTHKIAVLADLLPGGRGPMSDDDKRAQDRLEQIETRAD